MGNFIARAFVKIKNIETRTEVINTLWDIGLKQIGVALNQTKDCIQINQGFYQCKDDYWIVEKCDTLAIDCNYYANGDEDLAVMLFLYLATMKSELTTRTMVRWVKKIPFPNMPSVAIRAIGDISPLYEWVDGDESYYEVLTPLQFAEAVMCGDVKL